MDLGKHFGDTVFRYPKVSHMEQQLAKLVDMVGADASAYDLGSPSHISFRGDSMMFYREFGLRAGLLTSCCRYPQGAPPPLENSPWEANAGHSTADLGDNHTPHLPDTA